jgi:hypothetical protein
MDGHQRKFFGAHVCKVAFKHLPQTHRSYIQSFRILGQLLEYPPFLPKNGIVLVVVGGVPIFFIGILIFLLLRSPGEREEREKPLIADT